MALTTAEIQQVLDAIAALGKKIDGLPTATDLSGTNWLEILQGGVSKKISPELISLPGKLTITPVVTDGDGTAGDFTLMYQITGNIVDVSGFCRDYEIADGDATLAVQLDLTGTALEPAANFTGAFQLTGGAMVSDLTKDGGAEVVQAIAIATVTGSKKLQIALTLQTALSGTTYITLVSFGIKYELVVT
jgi:hypothetical protein